MESIDFRQTNKNNKHTQTYHICIYIYIYIYIYTKHPQPCWANVTDGDLWAILWQVLADKSPSSVRFRKVEAHSTPEHVALGVISASDRAANVKADELATMAQSTCDQMVGQLSTFFVY